MLIKMICFPVTKENLVRETDELQRALSPGWEQKHAWSTRHPMSLTMTGEGGLAWWGTQPRLGSQSQPGI